MGNYENIPDSIKSLPIFNCWRFEEKNGKRTKVPYSPKVLDIIKKGLTPNGMSSKNRELYCVFDDAVQAVTESQKLAIIGGTMAFDGIGIGIFPDAGYPSAIDIDHCIVNGELDPLAAEIVGTMNSYTEKSPSGTGLHILFLSDEYQLDTDACYTKKQIGKNQSGEDIALELYTGNSPRYMTFTGGVYRQAGIEERGQQAKAVAEKFLHREKTKTKEPEIREPVSPVMDDDKIIEILLNAANSERTQALWNGDISANGNDPSAADLALMNDLAFYTQDCEQLDRIFRQSGLYRQKWEERADYRQRTIGAALDQVYKNGRFFAAATAAADFAGLETAVTLGSFKYITAATVEYEPVKWLIEPYFYAGKLNLISGNPGVGKTAFAMLIAACVSAGKDFCGITPAKTGNVLILSVEDDRSTLRGRLEGNGANLEHCLFLDEDTTNALKLDSPALEDMIREKEIRLVIFDPLQAFLGKGIDMNKANETRPVLAKLATTASRTGCAILLLAHNGKNVKDKAPVYLALGSADIPAAMRSVMNIIRDPSNPDRVIATQTKSSNAKQGQAIMYSIGERGAVRFEGFKAISPAESETMRKRSEMNCPYEAEPLVIAVRALLAKHPGGGNFSYDELKAAYTEKTALPLCSSTRDIPPMAKRLYGEFAIKDGIQVEHGVKCGAGSSERGIKVSVLRPQG